MALITDPDTLLMYPNGFVRRATLGDAWVTAVTSYWYPTAWAVVALIPFFMK